MPRAETAQTSRKRRDAWRRSMLSLFAFCALSHQNTKFFLLFELCVFFLFFFLLHPALDDDKTRPALVISTSEARIVVQPEKSQLLLCNLTRWSKVSDPVRKREREKTRDLHHFFFSFPSKKKAKYFIFFKYTFCLHLFQNDVFFCSL